MVLRKGVADEQGDKKSYPLTQLQNRLAIKGLE